MKAKESESRSPLKLPPTKCQKHHMTSNKSPLLVFLQITSDSYPSMLPKKKVPKWYTITRNYLLPRQKLIDFMTKEATRWMKHPLKICFTKKGTQLTCHFTEKKKVINRFVTLSTKKHTNLNPNKTIYDEANTNVTFQERSLLLLMCSLFSFMVKNSLLYAHLTDTHWLLILSTKQLASMSLLYNEVGQITGTALTVQDQSLMIYTLR